MWRHIYIFIIVTLFAPAAAAQEPGPGAPSTNSPAASPFELARAVNRVRLRNERARSDRKIDLTGTWQLLGVPDGYFGQCSHCVAGLFRHELDGAPGAEVLLKLGVSHGVFRYLVFKGEARGRWRLLGHVDHDFNRYADSRHRVARAAGRDWLVVWGQEGSGTGYSLYGETWYEAGAEGLRPVLSYPAEGHVAPWPSGVGRAFKARPVADGGGAVAVAYTVSYERLDYLKDKYAKLYRNRHRLRYVWDEGRRRFVYDAARSDISEAEIAAVADLQEEPGEGQQVGGAVFFSAGDAWKRGGYDVFLKYNLKSLLGLARRGRAADAEWLRELLKDCAETPEREALERALGGRR